MLRWPHVFINMAAFAGGQRHRGSRERPSTGQRNCWGRHGQVHLLRVHVHETMITALSCCWVDGAWIRWCVMCAQTSTVAFWSHWCVATTTSKPRCKWMHAAKLVQSRKYILLQYNSPMHITPNSRRAEYEHISKHRRALRHAYMLEIQTCVCIAPDKSFYR